MYMQHSVTEDQAAWLKALDARDQEGGAENVVIPDDVLDALVAKGLVRRWQDGNVTLTLGGIRQVTLY